jgi:hypothetical protein
MIKLAPEADCKVGLQSDAEFRCPFYVGVRFHIHAFRLSVPWYVTPEILKIGPTATRFFLDYINSSSQFNCCEQCFGSASVICGSGSNLKTKC